LINTCAVAANSPSKGVIQADTEISLAISVKVS